MIREHLSSATNVVCPDPINLDPSDHALFARGKTMQLRERTIERHCDVDVYGRGPLWSDGKYVIEAFVKPSAADEWRQQRKHWRDFVERLFQPPVSFQPTSLWITDNWSCGYFHWTCDALPRLESIAQHQSLCDLTLLLPSKARRCRFIHETLKSYGLKEVRILGRFEHLKCRELLVPTHIANTGSYDPAIMDRLRRRFVDSCHAGVWRHELARKERLYISRRLAAHRRIENEDEILPILKEFGFRVVHAEQETWQRQMQLASRAGILVSSHGAGLTNMIPMSVGSSVLEIRDKVNELLYCYYTLAGSLGLQYYYQLADASSASAKWNRANLVVDPITFRDLIQRMVHDYESRQAANGRVRLTA